MNYQTIIWLAFISIMLAALVLAVVEIIWRRRYGRRGVVIDPHTPGCFMRRGDVVNEWDND